MVPLVYFLPIDHISHYISWSLPNPAFMLISSNLGPVSERRLSENSEYVNPEMRETLGFPFQNGRFAKPEKAG